MGIYCAKQLLARFIVQSRCYKKIGTEGKENSRFCTIPPYVPTYSLLSLLLLFKFIAKNMIIATSVIIVYCRRGLSERRDRKKENNLTGAEISVYSLIPYHILLG